MIPITRHIAIDERELSEQFIRSSGPGGQNVNKVATAVQLRFDVRRSPSLPPDVRRRLESIAGKRLTNDGVLVIESDRFRAQAQNRADARERLMALIREAAQRPKVRRTTRPTHASRQQRRRNKIARSSKKKSRGETWLGEE